MPRIDPNCDDADEGQNGDQPGLRFEFLERVGADHERKAAEQLS
jgi:hypothetical protein